jgi:putative N-acetylmannosamine-6-phosphate epimerase
MHEEGVKLIGDVSNFDQAQSAIESGCECLTTTLSGYTKDCKYNEEPDYKLLEELVSTNIPILAEGRYWERSQVKKAFDLGAHAVVVGSAITRPHLITERLCVL